MRDISYNRAIMEAMREEMLRDDTVFIMGEDVEAGVMRKTFGLIDEFGPERVRDTALAEVGFIGAAVGAAAAGTRPIAELMFWVHSYMAMDQIINQAAKMNHMFGGQGNVPLVIRGVAVNGGAAQHPDAVHSMFMHVPGLKIIAPTTPYDAKGLLKSAIRDNNPVLCFEAANLSALRGPVPEEEYTVPIGVAEVKREGTDVTVVGISGMAPNALAAAEDLAGEGISVEVVDPRSLAPLDTETILASVRKTGRLVVADEAQATCGASAEIAAIAAEDADTFAALKAPIQRVTRKPVPVPFSPPMLHFMTPNTDGIKAAIQNVMALEHK